MALVDQFGTQFRYGPAARGADRSSGMQQWEPVDLRDIDKLVPPCDRKTLLSASRRLYLNQPILQGAIEQKAMYAVGRAWLPKFYGQDKEFGRRATAWLLEQWLPICDIRGGQYNFWTTLFNLGVAIDRDGDDGILLTEDSSGFPRIQHIPAHRIATPSGMQDGPIASGPYRNAKIRDGVVYNRIGQPIAYAYLDDSGKLSDWLSARDFEHTMDVNWQEQGRGLPAFTSSVSALRDALQSHELEAMAQAMLSGRIFIEHNETGGPDLNDPAIAINHAQADADDACAPRVIMENMGSPMNQYFRAGSGSKLETFYNPRPGDAWESFQDRIIRAALAGVNWPYSLVWKASGQGTAERHEIAKAQRAVEDRQELLRRPAGRMVGYAVAKAQKLGILPESPDWWKWDFTMPQKLTIDDGRVAKELIEMWKAGAVNMTDIFGMMGKSRDEHYRERAVEVAIRKVTAKEIGDEYGVTIEDREMSMLTPNEQSASNQQEEA